MAFFVLFWCCVGVSSYGVVCGGVYTCIVVYLCLCNIRFWFFFFMRWSVCPRLIAIFALSFVAAPFPLSQIFASTMPSSSVRALLQSSRAERRSARFRALRRDRAFLEVIGFNRPPYLRLGEYAEIADVPDSVLDLLLPEFLSDWLPFLCAVDDVLGDDEGAVPVAAAAVVVEPPAAAAPLVASSSSSDLPPVVPLPPGPCRRRWASLVLFPAEDAAAAVANAHAFLGAGLVPPPSTARNRSRHRRRR